MGNFQRKFANTSRARVMCENP